MKKYCPTQNGKFVAYKPQYRNKSKEDWKNIPIIKEIKHGFPFPKAFGGIINTIGLSGYSQAKALMWAWASYFEGIGKEIETRLEEYEVNYQIQALKIEKEESQNDNN